MVDSVSTTRDDTTLAGYVTALRRGKWIIILSVLVGTASALVFASQQAKLYQASATVLLNPSPQLSTGAGPAAADAAARYVSTQAQVAHTATVAGLALQDHDSSGLDVQQFLADSSVSADASSNILTFRVKSGDASQARLLANAFANAFVHYRSSTDTRVLDERIRRSDRQARTLYATLNSERSLGTPTAATYQQISALNAQRTQLQQLKLLQSNAVSVSQQAFGAAQVQPKILQDGVAGALLGLVVGIALASIREALDTRVRTSDEATDSLGVPLLGRVREPARALQLADDISMMVDPSGRQSEAYRKLRVAFDFANLSHQARTVVISSAVAEEGKSTTVANLAVALALTGRRVCLIDMDLRRPHLERFFDLGGLPGLTDAVLGRATLQEVAYTITLPEAMAAPSQNGNGSGASRDGMLSVVPSGHLPPNPAELLESDVLKRFLAGVAMGWDLVLIDSAPLVPVSDGVTVANQVDAMVIVLRLSSMNRVLIGELRRTLDLCRAEKLGLVSTGLGQDGVYDDSDYTDYQTSDASLRAEV